jgi:hypothetical protein
MLVCDKTETAKRGYSEDTKPPRDLRRIEIEMHIARQSQSVKRLNILQSREQGASR